MRVARDAIPFHVSNLSVDDWLALFAGHGVAVHCFRHIYEPGIEHLDFTSALPSRANPDAFAFLPASRDDLYHLPTLSAVFQLTPS